MLEFRDVSYVVAGKEILKHVSFTIDDRFVAITGPNGSGKSTIAKLIAGIIAPTSGRILLDGVDITDLSVTERARNGSFTIVPGALARLESTSSSMLYFFAISTERLLSTCAPSVASSSISS